MSAPRPVPAVIAVVWRHGRVLLVRRHNPPNAFAWGFPGGKLEPGEPVLRAAERELREETGLTGTAVRAFDAVDVIAEDDPPAYHYLLVAVWVRAETGEPAAADDVDEAAWCDPAALPTPQVPELARVIAHARALADSA
jgi:ADP-ribose pyrophosphatase YjhB (NUDIX family)